jgi:AcrR family transcriptional regulator
LRTQLFFDFSEQTAVLDCGANPLMSVNKGRDNRVRNRQSREQALILAAGKLFASGGYDATTTRAIAAAAGCAEGLISRYFNGKAGLLLAVIRSRLNHEVEDLNEKVSPAATIEEEIQQLVLWEVQYMWEDREFLGVIIPRALLDPALGRMVRQIGPARRGEVIVQRLRRFPEGQSLPDGELKALADSIGVIGFMFGFMRPVVLRQDRARARKTARAIAKLLGRSLERPRPIPRVTNMLAKRLQ